MALTSLFKAEQPESSYLAASQALRSEYDRLAESNRMLRHSVIAMAAALILTSALSLYVARKPHIVPYVVEVAKTGEVVGTAQPLEANQSTTDAVIRFELAQFIADARSVLAGGPAEKAALHRVYDMARGAAATTLPIWYRAHPPFEIAAKETIQAQVDSVLREPSGSYEVRWTETSRNLNGDVLSATHWRALLAVQLVSPNPDHLLTNPIGLYVTQIDWSEEQGS
jgi:type IV secretory pathway TrbF-like protein